MPTAVTLSSQVQARRMRLCCIEAGIDQAEHPIAESHKPKRGVGNRARWDMMADLTPTLRELLDDTQIRRG